MAEQENGSSPLAGRWPGSVTGGRRWWSRRCSAAGRSGSITCPARSPGSPRTSAPRTAVPVHSAVAVCHDGEVVRSVAGVASLADRRAKLIPAGALPGGACRARLDGRLAVDLLASRRCSAGGYGLRGEVVTEHGDPPVADAEDLHQ